MVNAGVTFVIKGVAQLSDLNVLIVVNVVIGRRYVRSLVTVTTLMAEVEIHAEELHVLRIDLPRQLQQQEIQTLPRSTTRTCLHIITT